MNGAGTTIEVPARVEVVVVQDEQWLVGALLALVLIGVANTVFHALARQLVFAGINGAACVVALWCIYRIFPE